MISGQGSRVDGARVKPSSVSCLGAIFCCPAIIGVAGDVVARPVGRMMIMAPRQGTAAPHHAPARVLPPRRQAVGHGHFRSRGFGQSQAFGWGYGAPYYSGSFETAPPEGAESGEPPLAPPPGFYPVPFEGSLPQPCVTPLVIELRPKRPQQMPRIVYGAPSFCPPPIIARAP